MNQNDQQLAQKIRTRYVEKEATELDTLRALDQKVKRPANVFAYVFGSISAIIMGCGMSLIMTDIAQTVGIADPMLYGTVIGVVGLAMSLLTYPLYKGILADRRKKYADEIITISDKIMKEGR